MSEPKRLTRSKTNRVLAGVCGGIAEYIGMDATVVRILAFFIPGANLLMYLICALIIPEE